MSKIKYRKPPTMPKWFWWGQDDCWFCKNKNNCSNCSVVKRYRKECFGNKRKGRNSNNHKEEER